ncbi:Sir2p [Saccharomyces cerevisiae PE-2]|uniref:Sir2p n=1 Tax=Saccharomyces cerevisiae (strain JAY291) TaxID=574961 RepID=C7GPW1_YEAS2|nr:Sir2p [Saccharomyces cerevisiae JAY291]CAF1555694.1 Sir2p [Saccharomyces cerevisiae PE-2]
MTIPHMKYAVSKTSENKVSNTVNPTQDKDAIRKQPDDIINNDEPSHKKIKVAQPDSLRETNTTDTLGHTKAALGEVASMELKPTNDMDPLAVSAASVVSMSNDVLKPETPKGPIIISKNPSNGIFYGPSFTKRESLNARMFLKYYGAHKFLDTYLPEDLNSLYIYYLIKLLGFEVKDQALIGTINSIVHINSQERVQDLGSAISVTNVEDPLAKKQTVRLIKDLQRAINKVLCTRLRLSNFFTIDHFIQKLHTARKILVLTGAGVSTSLGIPDFRSSEGFYSKIKHLGLDDPQDVFNYNIFMHDPSVFYNIANMVLPPENIYSPLHSFIKILQMKGKLLRNYTQNIDNLESYAGISTDKLVQCHGSFATATCVTCHWNLPGERIFNKIRNLELPLCPYCYKKRREYFPEGYNNKVGVAASQGSMSERPPYILNSYGVLKPDITFFGEALPNKFHKSIREDILECDLLICIGTSLKVAPVSEIVNMVPSHVPQVLINRDPVKHAEFDLSLLGYCDDIAAMVAQKCGWTIPHKKWNDLKNKNFKCQEKDKGVYVVTSDEHPKTL